MRRADVPGQDIVLTAAEPAHAFTLCHGNDRVIARVGCSGNDDLIGLSAALKPAYLLGQHWPARQIHQNFSRQSGRSHPSLNYDDTPYHEATGSSLGSHQAWRNVARLTSCSNAASAQVSL